MTNKLMPWHWMLKHGELEEVTLESGSFLSDREIKDHYKHKYYPHPERLKTEIKKNTLFWYPPGVYKMYPRSLYGGEQREIAGIFLKNVIPANMRNAAFAGLEKMKWVNPKRTETKTAREFQKGRTAPKGTEHRQVPCCRQEVPLAPHHAQRRHETEPEAVGITPAAIQSDH